jgi:hypothetical protein
MRFAQDGKDLFDQIEADLKDLVVQTAEVAYKGQNALTFKTTCTQAAVDFANGCSQTMTQISDVITEQTTHIATALGGDPIYLEPPTLQVEMPKIDADTSVEMADSQPLTNLRSSIQQSFDAIENAFQDNLVNLINLGQEGWIGPEYDDTLSQVTTLTNAAIEDVNTSKASMMGDITTQLQSLGME